MIYKIFFIFILTYINLFSITSNTEYKIYKSKNYTIIYTLDYENEAKYIKLNIDEFLKFNNKKFGYKFDKKITITLISNKKQIANAFSTQIPFNMNVYYNGGSSSLDYFASTSWLKTLFVHEMIHNYQTNAKKSKISKTLFNFFGNNSFPIFISFIPLYTLVNDYLPSSFLEGNAVLNESLYGIGGRLHNGTLNALKNSIIINNKINVNTFINNTNFFPYGAKKYIIGGYYMKYLVYKYSLDKVNKFFYENSIHSINPLLLNSTFKNHFNISFEKSIQDFFTYTKNKYKNYKELKNTNSLVSSQAIIKLNKINNNIYFINSNLKNKKKLNIFNIKNNNLTSKNTKLNNDKVFIQNKKIYSNSSEYISNQLYKVGLYDKNKNILLGTKNKAVQDIYKNKIAYINIKKSFLKTKLYINNEYYNDISSSAIFDNIGNIYYFKQNNNIRELYKNKTKITELNTYYSKIVDIYKNDVYFISNTKNGSSLYKYSKNKIYKVSSFENIVDAKIINDNKILAVNVNSNEYNVNIIKNTAQLSDVYTSNIKNNVQFEFKTETTNVKLNSKNYNQFKELKFSSLYPSYKYSSYEGYIFNFHANFIDPLMYNSLDIALTTSNKKQITYATYNYKKNIDLYFAYYYLNEKLNNNKINKNSIINFRIKKNLLKKSRYIISSSLSYYHDDDIEYKKPYVIDISHNYTETFPRANLEFLSSDLSFVYKKDRTDSTYAIKYKFNKHIFNELYTNIKSSYTKSNTNITSNYRGIKINSNKILNPIDKTNIYLEGLDFSFYANEVKKLSLGFSKTFDYSLYFSVFPFSLKQESLFYQHNNLDIKAGIDLKIKENIIGLKSDILFAHKFSFPVIIKYIKNDFSKNNYEITLSIGSEF